MLSCMMRYIGTGVCGQLSQQIVQLKAIITKNITCTDYFPSPFGLENTAQRLFTRRRHSGTKLM
ncbi:UNVERIFIED_CONTAM: hypothetical protein GTU68_057549 [Idotea baltica]|nr:hypothetical protein [Idotea baltica]